MLPIDGTILSGQSGIPDRLERRVKYEKEGQSHNGGLSGNQCFAKNFDVMGKHLFDRKTIKVSRYSASCEYYKGITSESLGNRIAQEVFFKHIPPQDVSTINNRIKNARLPVIYGTSGTENNGKEFIQTMSAVRNINNQIGDKAIGIYFVEDCGHAVGSAIDDFLSFFSNKCSPEELAKCKALLLGCQDFNSIEKTGYKTAINFRAPTGDAVRKVFEHLGYEENLISDFVSIAEKLNEADGSFPDFIVALQSYSNMRYAYMLYGAEDMPIVICCKWSEFSNPYKSKTKVSDFAEQMIQMYSGIKGKSRDGRIRILNYVSPETGSETPIYAEHITGETELDALLNYVIEQIRLISNDESFSLEDLKNLYLNEWKYGGNSGKAYYLILNKILKEYPAIVFMDDYEKGGPHEALVALAESGDLNMYNICTPAIRTWAVSADIDPRNGDGDGTLGLAIPAHLILNNLIRNIENPEYIRISEYIIENLGIFGLTHGVGAVGYGETDISFQYTQNANLLVHPDPKTNPEIMRHSMEINKLKGNYQQILDYVTGQIGVVSNDIESMRIQFNNEKLTYEQANKRLADLIEELKSLKNGARPDSKKDDIINQKQMLSAFIKKVQKLQMILEYLIAVKDLYTPIEF